MSERNYRHPERPKLRRSQIVRISSEFGPHLRPAPGCEALVRALYDGGFNKHQIITASKGSITGDWVDWVLLGEPKKVIRGHLQDRHDGRRGRAASRRKQA